MERIRSLDLARGFTVLFIPAIHTGMLYSHPDVHTSALGYFLIAIAEGPGGQLLMLLMGLSFTFKARQNTQAILIRSMALLLGAYLLNMLKFVIPYSYGTLPDGVIVDLQLSSDGDAVWQLLGLGDILHFAAIATLILHGIYRQKHFHIWALTAVVAITVLSPFIWNSHFDNTVLNYVSGLFTGQPPRVFFPLFPWLVYPLVGLFIGYYFQKGQRKTMNRCGIVGGIWVMIGLMLEYHYPSNNPFGFYRTGIPATIWHLGIVLVTLYAWHMISLHIKPNVFFRLLTYSSKNITLIYLVQWVMICWMLPVFGYQELDALISAIVMVAMTINTYLLTFTFQIIKRIL